MEHFETGKTINSDQLQPGVRRHPIDDHGKLRYQYAKVTAGAALAANGTIGLFWLPPGRKRVLPHLCRAACSAFGAGRTLDLGHDKYSKSSKEVEAADVDAFADGVDVSAASAALALAANGALKFDMYSVNEVLVYATVLGGTMPAGATLEVLMAYLYE